MGYIAELLNRRENVVAVFIKARIKKATDIFKHDSTRLNFFDKADGFREQISFIFLSELLSCYGERRARNASSQQIDTVVWASVKIVNICANDVPLRAVLL